MPQRTADTSPWSPQLSYVARQNTSVALLLWMLAHLNEEVAELVARKATEYLRAPNTTSLPHPPRPPHPTYVRTYA